MSLLSSFLLWRKNYHVREWFVFIHCWFFLSLGFVLLGYSSQLHHVICFTWLRATLHCVWLSCFCESLPLHMSSHLGLTLFFDHFLMLFSFKLFFFTLTHFWTHTKMCFACPSLSIKLAATLQPKHCSPAWLGLSPWSNSHKAHRPCRPYGAT